MKKNSLIGYIIAIVSGLLIVGSAFLSLTMISVTGTLQQGDSLFAYMFGGVAHSGALSTANIFYMMGIIFAIICVLCAVVGLILAMKDKHSKIFLLIERIFSVISFLCIIISLIILGIYLSAIEAIGYNFTGFGILVAVFASLLLIEGMFLVRAKVIEKSKE